MLTRRLTRALVAGPLALLLAAIGAAAATPALAAAATPAPTAPAAVQQKAAGKFGLTVSWTPTNKPVQAKIGGTTTGTFWVTNTTGRTIPVTIRPGIAVPGNDGKLAVRDGIDRRFSKIAYTPSAFDARPHTTTTIAVRVTVPGNLGPGVYLLPGVVQPHAPKKAGNINIEQQIIAPVTFQIPGHIQANLVASFIASLTRPDRTSLAGIAGLPAIQVAPTGVAVLRVRDESNTSLYSYNEIVSKQFPGGIAKFAGHTPNAPTDLRHEPSLFFPRLYRDYPISWTPEPLGIGLAHLTAYVSFSPNPATVKQKSVSTSILVITPWWFLVVSLYLAILLIRLNRRAAAQRRPHSGRRSTRSSRAERSGSLSGWTVGMLVLALVTAFVACVANLPLFVGAGLLGAAFAAAVVLSVRRHGPTAVARGLLVFHIVTGLLILAGTVGLVAGVIMHDFPVVTPGLALLAGAGVWVLIASAVQRRGTSAGKSPDRRALQGGTAPGRSAIPASDPASDGTPSPETVL